MKLFKAIKYNYRTINYNRKKLNELKLQKCKA